MKWGLQSTLLSKKDQLAVLEAVKDLGIDWVEVPMMPFATELPELDVTADEKIVFYGSTTLVKLVQQANFTPGVFFNPKTFNYRQFIKDNGDKMLNYGSRIMRIRDLTYDSFPEIAFIRPIDDLKAFSGEVLTADEFISWQGRLGMHGLDEYSDLEIVVGRPKNLLYEYRAFVVDNEVVDVTQYVEERSGRKLCIKRIDNDPIKERIVEFIRHIKTPEDVVVVDIAIVDESSLCEGENDMKIIEFNAMNASGFYDHDIPKIIKAVSDYVIRQ